MNSDELLGADQKCKTLHMSANDTTRTLVRNLPYNAHIIREKCRNYGV
ncbi:MAG: hypothetical protein IJ691_10820 [Lachnospiraceae bacterium]|nr:hypothetical protein [Lachnospiraceae bacterium]